MPNFNWSYFGPQTPAPELIYQLWDLQPGSAIAVDIETVSLDDTTMIGIGFSPNSKESFYFKADSPQIPWHLLENPGIMKIFHNGHFDIRILEELGHPVNWVMDTIIAAQLLGYAPALYSLVLELFGITLTTIEDLLGKKGKSQLKMTDIPEDKVALKCSYDTLYTYKVWEKILPEIPAKAFLQEMELMPILMDMENRGMAIDEDRLEQHKIRITKEVNYYKNIAYGMGFNPGSSMQVAAVLESRGWGIRHNRITGKPIMNKLMLKTYYHNDPISQLTLLYRENKILQSTFIEAMQKKHIHNGRIHGTINQIATNSGRLSRSKPNLQNIPLIMRDIFIASPGCEFEAWDLNQIELRVLAFLVEHYTGDSTMADIYRGNTNALSDIHVITGQKMTEILGHPVNRKNAKMGNFLVVYGGDEHTLLQRHQMPLDEGKAFLAAYFKTYPGIKILMDMTNRELESQGYVETLLGRRRYFTEALESGNPYELLKARRAAFNHKIQGTAGEDFKALQIRAKNYPQCNTIHDEVVFDKPKGEPLNHTMSESLSPYYRTPMEGALGKNWKVLDEDESSIGVWG